MPIYHRTNICLNVKLFPFVAHIIDAAICMCLLPIKKRKKKENILKDFIDRCTKTHGNGRTSEIKITSVKKTTKSLFTKQEYN